MVEQGYKDFVNRLESICTKYADKTAITYMRNDDTKTQFTFSNILKNIQITKQQLSDAGLCPGDRVAIVAPHSPHAIIAGLSLAYSNITSVLIDASLPAEEISRLLVFSDVRSVLTVSENYKNLEFDALYDVPVFDINTISITIKEFESTLKNSKPKTADPQLDVVTILYSSGTTASVKGVMITYNAFLESIKMFATTSDITDSSSFLYVLPFHHLAGFTGGLACLLNGCDVGMIEDVNAIKLQKGLIEYQPSIFSMVPRVYDVMAQKMMAAVKEKGIIVESVIKFLLSLSRFMRKYLKINLGKLIFAKIRKKVFGDNCVALGTGATLCSKETTALFLNLGFKWANFYALTETNVPTVNTSVFDNYPIVGVGKVNRYKDITIKIYDPDENGIGEIRVKTVLIMKGYFRDPELTATAFDEDGYFKTGDLGFIDKKNYLHVTGRIKEAIMLHTGKKVAPSDVDELFNKLCPDIAIASCGVPYRDGSYDEIHLFVEKGELLKEEQLAIKNRIMEFSAETSTLYQISSLHFIDKLPTTSVGKVKRFQLKEIAMSEKTHNQ